MESRDYENILDALPDTGVYVVREADRRILYFNRKIREVSPAARLGGPCREIWSGSCACCPLLTIEDRRESRSVSCSDSYGGLVDLTASRVLWEDGVPAFIVTVSPRPDAVGRAYREILRVDLAQDTCDVLKSDPEGWQLRRGGLSPQLEQFARSGAIHPGDVERFAAFIQPHQLRSLLQTGQETLRLIYRRRTGGAYRWNLMELFPDPVCCGEIRRAILSVRDIHDVLRKGLEGVSVRSQELIRTLGERNFSIYTIDLNAGTAAAVRVDGQMREGASTLAPPWSELMRSHIKDRLHEAYQAEFQRRFSLEGLRRTRSEGRQKAELLCQWRSGEDYRYISVTAYFGQGPKASDYTVLALQDVDKQIRRELAHSMRDMQMAAILRSRFKMMNTVDLESGQCERVNLALHAGPESSQTGDYGQYIQTALSSHVHPADRDSFRACLSLEHLRERAETIEDYGEEVCQYRLLGQPVRWIELRVIYSRQGERVMVNILGQDVTREKQQEASQLQTLEDRAHIISSLSSLFFSTYYIDLDHDSFRAVIQLRRVEDVLGEEVNFTAALQIYANHFIHPDDREEYLRVMSIQNLREKLRWWQPCVAVEFRKLPDDAGSDNCGWVRATAVLAQNDADDMPKTVVYAAQDISGSRHER